MYREVKFADVRMSGDQWSTVYKAMHAVMEAGDFINGQAVQSFEDAWAGECEMAHCVGVASGTAALMAMLEYAREVKRCHYWYTTNVSQWVIMPEFSFMATALAARQVGLNILYCRCNPDGTMDQEHCLRLMEENEHLDIIAVVPVWIFGQRIELSHEFYESGRPLIIMDACQAHGEFQGIACAGAAFSFYPTKNLGACGDAGAVVTDDINMADFVRDYINYGTRWGGGYKERASIYAAGDNRRMDTIQAAVLYSKLWDSVLFDGNIARKELAKGYAKLGINSIAHEPTSWHLYPIVVEDPEGFRAVLSAHGIQTGVHYPYTLPDVVYGSCSSGMAHSTYISKHVVTLPIHPGLDYLDLVHVSQVIHQSFETDDISKLWRLKDD